MPRTVTRDGLTWARPWLDKPRESIAAYARRHRLQFVADPSNEDLRYDRSRLRQRLWPMLLQHDADAETALAPSEASATSSFVAAFTILAREGLEALLIVVAMIAFLSKAGRRDMLPYVHGGWVVALVAGAVTWAAAACSTSPKRPLRTRWKAIISARS